MTPPSPCKNCGMALTDDNKFCPRCGTPTDPTDLSTVPGVSQPIAPANYGSPPHEAPQQSPYPPSNPYPYAPPPPWPTRNRSTIVLIALVVLLILSGIIGYSVFTRGAIQASATATAQTQASVTAQAQLNATATAQTQANATATAIAIATGPPIGFSVTTLRSGQVIPHGIAFTINGTYSSAGSGRVWVVLEDNLGQYYLQTPPVRFNGDGTWIAMNINPALEITRVDFVYVTTAGDMLFKQKVAAKDFGAFSTLPAGSTPLKSIPIVVS